MIVYRGPREAFGGGVRRRVGPGTVPPAPNNAVKKLVCSVTAAMLIPVARVVTTISLRSMSGSFRRRLAPATPQPAGRFPRAVSRFPHGVSVGRVGDAERGALAELAFQAQGDVPGPPDQGVAGSKPGRSPGWHAVAGDVHQ